MTIMREIFTARQRQKFATDAGTAAHKKLQHTGANDDIIKSHPELAVFFGPNAKTEVPIAGILNGKFISRRIDRLVKVADTIYFLDYKTDINKSERYDKYIAQIREYSALLCSAYPGAAIRGFILWAHDFMLEEIK